MHSAGAEPAEVLDDGELELASGAPDAVGDQLGVERVRRSSRPARCRRHRPSRRSRADRIGQRLGWLGRPLTFSGFSRAGRPAAAPPRATSPLPGPASKRRHPDAPAGQFEDLQGVASARSRAGQRDADLFHPNQRRPKRGRRLVGGRAGQGQGPAGRRPGAGQGAGGGRAGQGRAAHAGRSALDRGR